MSFEGLQERLTALQETTVQLRELIDRLAGVKVEPAVGTEDESASSGELSAEIAQVLRDGQEELKVLGEEVQFVKADEHDRERLEEGVEKLGKELARSRLSFRKARISAKHTLTHAERLEHELLVQSYSAASSEAGSPIAAAGTAKLPTTTRTPRYTQQQQSSLSEEDQQTVGASSNVTNALRRTHDLIASELARSEYAHEILTESSSALKSLNESYTSLDTMLASSKDLLGTLLRSQKSDTWYLQTAMYMLMVTGAWLVFRRILYGPMWWLVWLPLRLVFGLGTKAGSAVIQGRSGAGESGKVQVGNEGGNVLIEGLPNDDLPTVRVGREKSVETGHPDSMMEKVGKIVDAVNEADKLGQIPEDDETVAENARNTKKRMWEEPEAVVEGTRPRDEL
ncbi:Fc.00g065870.m01.CDS01 [Cosmosporella sp. VM-42]